MRGNNSCTEDLLETWSRPIVIKEVVNNPKGNDEGMFLQQNCMQLYASIPVAIHI